MEICLNDAFNLRNFLLGGIFASDCAAAASTGVDFTGVCVGPVTLRNFLGRASSIRFLHGEVEGGYVNPQNTRDVVFDIHIHTALVDFLAKDHASKSIASVMGNTP